MRATSPEKLQGAHKPEVAAGKSSFAGRQRLPCANTGPNWSTLGHNMRHGNEVGLEKHSPYASTTGQLGCVVRSNKVYLPQEVPLVSTGLASRRINANC